MAGMGTAVCHVSVKVTKGLGQICASPALRTSADASLGSVFRAVLSSTGSSDESANGDIPDEQVAVTTSTGQDGPWRRANLSDSVGDSRHIRFRLGVSTPRPTNVARARAQLLHGGAFAAGTSPTGAGAFVRPRGAATTLGGLSAGMLHLSDDFPYKGDSSRYTWLSLQEIRDPRQFTDLGLGRQFTPEQIARLGQEVVQIVQGNTTNHSAVLGKHAMARGFDFSREPLTAILDFYLEMSGAPSAKDFHGLIVLLGDTRLTNIALCYLLQRPANMFQAGPEPSSCTKSFPMLKLSEVKDTRKFVDVSGFGRQFTPAQIGRLGQQMMEAVDGSSHHYLTSLGKHARARGIDFEKEPLAVILDYYQQKAREPSLAEFCGFISSLGNELLAATTLCCLVLGTKEVRADAGKASLSGRIVAITLFILALAWVMYYARATLMT